MGTDGAREDPNAVTGTFLVNNHTSSVLFDTGADLSFVSTDFKRALGLESHKLHEHFSIELANGKTIRSEEVVRNCALKLGDHEFSIDLLPIEFGSFDIVVGMDWLSKDLAEVICFAKVVRVPLPSGEVLSIQGGIGRPRCE